MRLAGPLEVQHDDVLQIDIVLQLCLVALVLGTRPNDATLDDSGLALAEPRPSIDGSPLTDFGDLARSSLRRPEYFARATSSNRSHAEGSRAATRTPGLRDLVSQQRRDRRGPPGQPREPRRRSCAARSTCSSCPTAPTGRIAMSMSLSALALPSAKPVDPHAQRLREDRLDHAATWPGRGNRRVDLRAQQSVARSVLPSAWRRHSNATRTRRRHRGTGARAPPARSALPVGRASRRLSRW